MNEFSKPEDPRGQRARTTEGAYATANEGDERSAEPRSCSMAPSLPLRKRKGSLPTSTSSAAEMAAAEEEGQAQAETVSTVAATKQAATIDTLSKACAYGDMDRLKTLLLESGASALAKPDAEGYYPLQWACLNNQVGCAKFLLEDALCRKHVQIDAQDTTTGQTALHWAAVRGCVGILAQMHDYGASAVIRDNKGYTSAHVAAQYGQTEFLYFLKMRCKIQLKIWLV